MKALVAIKRVVDPYVKIRVKTDGSGVETDNVKKAINPFDEIAIEEAIRLKEKNIVSEVILVAIGDDKTVESIRAGLALGADRAIHIQFENTLSPLTTAKILKNITEKEKPQLILLGKQAIDNDNNQVGQMLAGLLDYPQATFASKIEIADNQATVTREIDGGLETLKLSLPAVITSDLRLNTPRYATLPNIMKAKSKPLETIDFDSLGIANQNTLEVIKVLEPKKRQAGKRVENVMELIDLLKNEAKVIA